MSIDRGIDEEDVAVSPGSCAWAFSSCGKQGQLGCGVWTSHCGGFSRQPAGLEHAGSVVVAQA